MPMTQKLKTPVVSRDDIVTLISRIQGHRNRARLGPEYLAETVSSLRLAYRANGRQREYWVEAALILFRQGV